MENKNRVECTPVELYCTSDAELKQLHEISTLDKSDIFNKPDWKLCKHDYLAYHARYCVHYSGSQGWRTT